MGGIYKGVSFHHIHLTFPADLIYQDAPACFKQNWENSMIPAEISSPEHPSPRAKETRRRFHLINLERAFSSCLQPPQNGLEEPTMASPVPCGEIVGTPPATLTPSKFMGQLMQKALFRNRNLCCLICTELQ